MSLSWRISTSFDDRSQRSIPSSASGTGATVVAGSRSIEEPILFQVGETQRMLNLLGVPETMNQGLLEAIEFNKSYPLYVVAPAMHKKFNYISFVSANADISSVVANDYLTSLDIDNSGVLSLGADFAEKTLTCTIPKDIVGGIEKVELYASDSAEPLKVTITGTVISGKDSETLAGTVTMGEDNYVLTITKEGSHEGSTYSVRYKRNMGDTLLIIAQRGSGSFLQGTFTKKVLKAGATESANTYYLAMNYQVKDYRGNYSRGSGSPVNFSLEKSAADGFQNSLNAETRFETNDYFKAIYNPNNEGLTSSYKPSSDVSVTTFSFQLKAVNREGTLEETDIAAGYKAFHKTNSYAPDLFFDATGSKDAVTALEEIRNTYHKFARVLVPLYTTDPNSISQALEAIKTLPADRGFSAYWGEFEISNPYSLAHPIFKGVPMGMIAKRHSDAISLSYGGLAVAWIDENGVGGQLSGARLLKGLADPSEAELRTLDENRINPVIYDDTYGPMILSRRTTYTDYSDYSFNDYSGIIDYCVKNIQKNALPYQIIKLNDANHRSLVRNRIESILRPLTVAPYNVIRDYAVKCDSENNNNEVLANEEFVVEVAIQVTSKSRTIKLIFINTPQTMNVQEVLA